MLYVKIEEELLHVNVYLTILEIHMLPVDQNVQQMQNAHLPKHVKTYIVLTLVQLQDVVLMLNVKLLITYQTVFVSKDILVILLLPVDSHHWLLNLLKQLILATQIHVDQTAIHQE